MARSVLHTVLLFCGAKAPARTEPGLSFVMREDACGVICHLSCKGGTAQKVAVPLGLKGSGSLVGRSWAASITDLSISLTTSIMLHTACIMVPELLA